MKITEINPTIEEVYKEFEPATFKEINDIVENARQEKTWKEFNIEKRKKGFTLITYDGETRIFPDKSESNIFKSKEKNLEKVNGVCTFPGEVKGLVRKIMQKNEIESTKDKEIIVTPMTSLDYIAIMNKVSGIITDEGGLTCHAAQISREYKIPCIIGTGNSTKVFNTGDNIYLNASEGFVEIK